MINLNECILYRNFEHGELLDQMVSIIHAYESKELSDAALLEEKRTLYYNCMNQLVEMAGAYGFSDNLWHDYLTFLLVNHENAFRLRISPPSTPPPCLPVRTRSP